MISDAVVYGLLGFQRGVSVGIPVGLAGVGQGADSVVAEPLKAERDPFHSFDQIVDRYLEQSG